MSKTTKGEKMKNDNLPQAEWEIELAEKLKEIEQLVGREVIAAFDRGYESGERNVRSKPN